MCLRSILRRTFVFTVTLFLCISAFVFLDRAVPRSDLPAGGTPREHISALPGETGIPSVTVSPTEEQNTVAPGVSKSQDRMLEPIFAGETENPAFVHLEVPFIQQMPELPLGCEITAVTMLLQYAGAEVDKIGLAKEMPRHKSNVNKGYVGDPFRYTQNKNTIYPPALMDLVSKYAGEAVNLTGCGFDKLTTHIDKGAPVVVWIRVKEVNGLNSICVSGYDDSYIYYNDPMEEGERSMTHDQFMKVWNSQKQRAISYVPRAS